MKRLIAISTVLLLVMSGFAATLSDEEISGILLMREEEKLARDVYLELYELWGLRTFSNIASAEQNHMDRVKFLIDKYNLEDPVLGERGKFTDEHLQTLYNELVTMGSKTIVDAVRVGMPIEELYIKDLLELMEQAENEELLFVYSNLEKGSENHLRAFNRQLEKYNANYDYQYITEKFANEILSNK
ncbi:MAG: DUF2202 domain-containing protein [Thermotogota bacterium]|nr:DUF2202 domain-containing protein [Thermotogota bacterium]